MIAICLFWIYNRRHLGSPNRLLGACESLLSAFHEPPAFSDPATLLAAANDAVAGAIVAAVDQSRSVARTADRSARHCRDRASSGSAKERRGCAGHAQSLVSLRFV